MHPRTATVPLSLLKAGILIHHLLKKGWDWL
jgi:hypothetical protein